MYNQESIPKKFIGPVPFNIPVVVVVLDAILLIVYKKSIIVANVD